MLIYSMRPANSKQPRVPQQVLTKTGKQQSKPFSLWYYWNDQCPLRAHDLSHVASGGDAVRKLKGGRWLCQRKSALGTGFEGVYLGPASSLMSDSCAAEERSLSFLLLLLASIAFLSLRGLLLWNYKPNKSFL